LVMLTLRHALAIIVIAGQANKFPRPGPMRFGFVFFDDGVGNWDIEREARTDYCVHDASAEGSAGHRLGSFGGRTRRPPLGRNRDGNHLARTI